MLPFGVDNSGITYAQAIGMTVYRNDVPWNFTKGIFTGIESTPGTYNATNIASIVSLTSTLKAAGFTPLYLIESNAGQVMCPTLSSALIQGTNYTSISITKLPFAITSGDSIILTDPANQAHTQTIIAAASMAKGASGSLTVNSFTAGFAFPAFVASTTNPPVAGQSGAWVYDTTWVACTPQHLANTMVHLVSTLGLQGLHWELFNEPDGLTWAVDSTLVTQAYQLAYPAMKAADPTCVVHGICIENLAPIGYPEGTAYYELCAQEGILGNYDIMSFHQYSNNAVGGNLDAEPDALNIWGKSYWKMIADFQSVRIAKSDTTPMWCTEFGWQSGTAGVMTPQLQAQFFQNLLVTLSGTDPINGVPFSSYLKAMLQFQMTGSFQNWSVIDPTTGPKPAYQVLGQLIAGH